MAARLRGNSVRVIDSGVEYLVPRHFSMASIIWWSTVMKASRPQAQLRARSGLCSIAGTSERASSTNVDHGGQVSKGVKMRKHSALLAAALLVSSTGVGMAQGQSPNSQQKSPATSGQSSGSQSDPRGPGMTGAPSSTNPQAGGGGAGYQTPRETPEAGGAPTTQTPNPNRR
jgi:hypothetical protein